MLREVGVNRAGQNVLFRELADMSKQQVYDLSSMLSRSMSINQAEKGYNKDKIHVPQINLALLCSADTGLPAMIRSLPGSVKDIKTLYHTINELDIGGKVLILDRGFFSEGTIKFLGGKGTSYVLPTKRNSHYYDTRIHFTEYFSYHSRLIKCGKRKCGNFYLYLFEDQDLRLEEQKTLYRKKAEHKIEKKKFEEGTKKAEINHKFTPIDLLFKYSKVYHLEMRERGMIAEVPKKVLDLDEALGLYMFPKNVRS